MIKIKNKRTRFTLSETNGQTGFTLIELLVVTGLIVIITGMVTGILITSLRGGAKSKITNEVSQNGNYAISVISQDLVQASNVVYMGDPSRLSCINKTVDPYEAWPGPNEEVQLEYDDGSSIIFTCDSGSKSITKTYTPLVGVPTTVELLDIKQVRTTSCSFTCSQGDLVDLDEYANPVVEVSFTLVQEAPTTSAENIAEANFKTSATLRNFRPY